MEFNSLEVGSLPPFGRQGHGVRSVLTAGQLIFSRLFQTFSTWFHAFCHRFDIIFLFLFSFKRMERILTKFVWRTVKRGLDRFTHHQQIDALSERIQPKWMILDGSHPLRSNRRQQRNVIREDPKDQGTCRYLDEQLALLLKILLVVFVQELVVTLIKHG